MERATSLHREEYYDFEQNGAVLESNGAVEHLYLVDPLIEEATDPEHLPADIATSDEAMLRRLLDHPILTEEQERDLAIRKDNGDKQAKQDLVRHNLRFVYSLSVDKKHWGMPLMDLFQEGCRAAAEAAEEYDHTRARFTTFLALKVDQAHKRAIPHWRFLRLPESARQDEAALYRAEKALVQENGRDPSHEELMEKTGLDEDRIIEIKRAKNGRVSADKPLTDEAGSISLLESIPDDSVEVASEAVGNRHSEASSKALNEALQDLQPRELSIVIRKFGLGEDGVEKSLREIGEELGISDSEVKRLLVKSMNILRMKPGLREIVLDHNNENDK